MSACGAFSGEELAGLRGFRAHRRRHLQQQTEQTWCLTLSTDAVITWMTGYLSGQATSSAKAAGSTTSSLSTHSENIGLVGTITLDIDAELTQLGRSRHRPLRQPPVLDAA